MDVNKKLRQRINTNHRNINYCIYWFSHVRLSNFSCKNFYIIMLVNLFYSILHVYAVFFILFIFCKKKLLAIILISRSITDLNVAHMMKVRRGRLQTSYTVLPAKHICCYFTAGQTHDKHNLTTSITPELTAALDE